MSEVQKSDPNVRIPDAVRAAGARADAFYQQQTEEPANGDTTEKPEGVDSPSEAAETTEAAETPAKEVTFESNAPPRAEDEQSYEHRYKSMKGRFERSQDQLRTMAERVQSLEQVIATMQATATARNDQITDAVTGEKLITPEEENDYGQDFLKVVGKKAREELSPVIKQYEAKIAQLEARLAGVNGYVAQDVRQRMFDQLDQQIPNWREVNKDETFLNWLQLPDLYSGAIRHELLKAAFERNDTPRVAAFFQGFLTEEAAVAPVSRETGRSNAPAKRSLEELAAPGRAKSAAASSAPAEKPSFTSAQIAKFYADAAAGKFRGREAERDRIERQIFDAQRDGRIR